MQSSVLTVSQLNFYIKSIINDDYKLKNVLIKGEITNFKSHLSGHMYFSLKDLDCVVKAVMFKGSASRLKFVPENGMKVVISGRVDVFERDGTYQIYVNDIIPDGIGQAALALEQLKQKLFTEGLFDENNKNPLPYLPTKIGLIAGANSAALFDVLTILKNRYPIAEVVIFPVKVQGEDADKYISFAIEFLDKNSLCDVIICARGGGSNEDLGAFNSEVLARYAFLAKTPIVSAVGHEIDYTILDLVADVRAHTPTDAANIFAAQLENFKSDIDNFKIRLDKIMQEKISDCESKVNIFKQKNILKNANELINSISNKNEDKKTRLNLLLNTKINNATHQNKNYCEKLSILSPLNTLKRGYSIVLKGEKLANENEVKTGDLLDICFAEKTIKAEVKEISNKKLI